MQLHTLKRNTPNKDRRYVARGGKRGKTAGRGTKGQKARAGAKFRPEIRDTIKRLPKLRGYAFNSITSKPEVVNVRTIETAFKAGDTVSPATLLAKRLVRRMDGKLPRVKILADGEITKKVTVQDCFVSPSAQTKIEKAGGTIEK